MKQKFSGWIFHHLKKHGGERRWHVEINICFVERAKECDMVGICFCVLNFYYYHYYYYYYTFPIPYRGYLVFEGMTLRTKTKTNNKPICRAVGSYWVRRHEYPGTTFVCYSLSQIVGETGERRWRKWTFNQRTVSSPHASRVLYSKPHFLNRY